MRERKETNVLYVNDNDDPIKFEGLDKKHVCLCTNWSLSYMCANTGIHHMIIVALTFADIYSSLLHFE